MKRVITDILFVAILVGCILYSSFSFGILFMATSVLTIYKFGQLINSRAEGVSVNKTIIMLGGAYLSLAVIGFCIDATDSKIFIPYLLLLLCSMISKLYLKKASSMLNWAHSIPNQLYIGLPFALLNILVFHTDPEYSSVSYNPVLPLSIFIFLWLSGTGACCVGSLTGKHRLFERISPKESWGGSIDGGVVAVGASFALAHYFTIMSMWEWAGLTLVVVVFGTWDDLTGSLLKRQLHVKDSGTILPGHEGMLDRFDSALIAIPTAVFYLYALTWF